MRASLKLVIIFIFMNSGAELMRSSGMTTKTGINPSPGAASNVQNATAAANEIEPGGGLGETLFSMYLTVSESINAIFSFLTAAPDMLVSIGVPEMLVFFIFAPVSIVIAADLVYYLMNR